MVRVAGKVFFDRVAHRRASHSLRDRRANGSDGVDAPPTASMYQSGGVEHHLREASMGNASTIGLDLAKNVFQAHGADASGAVMFRAMRETG
jgi:hypothetical protein